LEAIGASVPTNSGVVVAACAKPATSASARPAAMFFAIVLPRIRRACDTHV
jgi:hypothetical protein